MAELKDVVAYLCTKYPNKVDLSKARLTKMVYLADWKCALEHGRQMTDISWKFNHYGPYVDDVTDLAIREQEFVVEESQNLFGSFMQIIRVREGVSWSSLSDEDKKILEFAIEKSAKRGWGDFIRLVYSTYPVVSQERYSKLDLVALAGEYKTKFSMFKSEA